MYRNISNMLLVLFAVVLILPAFEGEGFLFAVDRCYLALWQSGKTYCQLNGYDNYDGLTHGTCELGCGDSKVKLPTEACPNGSLHKTCSQDDFNHLQKWSNDLMDKKDRLVQKWCYNEP
uniref:Putative ixodes 10 kDa peptide protein n=1 Tax=Ixodes ricinus TaxID=34613 RepID=A0A0K8RIE1_IXORI